MKIHQYNQMMKQLTDPGPSKKVQSLRKKIKEQPNASVEELVNQVQKEFSEDEITTKQRPSALDKATTNIIKNHVKYDEDEDLSVSYNPTTKIFSNKSRTIGFQKYEDADNYNKLIGAKTDNYPKQATPEQVQHLKKNLDKMKEQNKPTYKKGEAKIIIDEMKRQKRLANPILKTEPIKIDTSLPKPLAPTQEDPRLKQLEENFNRIVKENNFKKSRGLANLTGLLTDEF